MGFGVRSIRRRDGQSRPLSDGVVHLGEEPIAKRPHVWSCLLPLQAHEMVRTFSDRELGSEGDYQSPRAHVVGRDQLVG